MLVNNKYANSLTKEKSYRTLFNSQSSLINSLSLLGKTTGMGQAILDEILVIMHRHHIPDNNKSHFYEQ